jgi:hypothetical protein
MRYLITWPNRDQQIVEGDSLIDVFDKTGPSIRCIDTWVSEDEYPGEFDEFLRKSGGKLFLKYEYDNG